MSKVVVINHLTLDSEATDEAVEVSDDDHIGLAGLHQLDCLPQSVTAMEWR